MILLKLGKVLHVFHFKDGYYFSVHLGFSKAQLSTTSVIEFSELEGNLEDI